MTWWFLVYLQTVTRSWSHILCQSTHYSKAWNETVEKQKHELKKTTTDEMKDDNDVKCFNFIRCWRRRRRRESSNKQFIFENQNSHAISIKMKRRENNFINRNRGTVQRVLFRYLCMSVWTKKSWGFVRICQTI